MMYFVLEILSIIVSIILAFILGGICTRRVMLDALDEARRQRQMEEYYRLCGYQKVGDPAPYIPPTIRPKTPRARILPHMNRLDRILHEGKRGTILVTAKDRKEN